MGSILMNFWTIFPCGHVMVAGWVLRQCYFCFVKRNGRP